MARRTGRGSVVKSKGVKVDLSGVEVGGKTLAEGRYLVSLDSATIETSQNSGSDYIKLEFEVVEGKDKGAKIYHNCSLQPQALFNLKSVLVALGFDIPKKAFDLDLDALIGLECMVEVSHELYEGKKKARITEFINSEDEGEGDEDLEELLEDLNLSELKELAKELGVSAASLKKAKSEQSLMKIIMGFDEDEINEKYDELFGEEEASDEEEGDEDYSDMSLAELKAECKDRGLRVKKGATKDDLIEILEEDDED